MRTEETIWQSYTYPIAEQRSKWIKTYLMNILTSPLTKSPADNLVLSETVFCSWTWSWLHGRQLVLVILWVIWPQWCYWWREVSQWCRSYIAPGHLLACLGTSSRPPSWVGHWSPYSLVTLTSQPIACKSCRPLKCWHSLYSFPVFRQTGWTSNVKCYRISSKEKDDNCIL